MARRKAHTEATGTALGRLPVELQAGACMETWAPDDALGAWRRWRKARDDWLLAHGVHPAWDHQRIPEPLSWVAAHPWSFDFLQGRDPDHLARQLKSLGLPPEWTPVFVEFYDYGPSLLPEHLTWHRFVAMRNLPADGH